MTTEINILTAAIDNYSYLIVVEHEAVIIDACCEKTIHRILDDRHLHLRMILSTHHHYDHTDANTALAISTGCTIVGGDSRISGISQVCRDHDYISTIAGACECIAVPGHTSGSFAYYFSDYNTLFTGDTLFYAGCGRILEGTAEELYTSLMKIATFPAATRLYCGHEYTLENLAFSRKIEPENQAVDERMITVKEQLRHSLVYGPSTIGLEKATNPFLRCSQPTVQKNAGLTSTAPPVMVFRELRRKKDVFG